MHPTDTEATTTSEDGSNKARLSPDDAKELTQLKDLLWGQKISLITFANWSLGFEFSTFESSALVQNTGGELIKQ